MQLVSYNPYEYIYAPYEMNEPKASWFYVQVGGAS
jgi:hypothetical protein